MGTLYVSTLPVGGLEDWPLRAQRRLPQVSLVMAENLDTAHRALADLPLAAPLVGPEGTDALLGTLPRGDAMLLLDGRLAAPGGPAVALVRAAAEQGFPVEALPGPALPVTALVVSGLPADSFVYLGRLPAEPVARRDLLASVAPEKRTLVLVIEGPEPAAWDLLSGALGARPALLWAGGGEAGAIWRGTLGPSVEAPGLPEGPCVLVIGGAAGQAERWTGERLGAELRACLGRGLSPGQAAKHLAAPSGWPRRTIYRIAAEAGPPGKEEPNDGRAH